MLESDRPFHRRTVVLMEEEARLSRAAWAQSMDACDQTHSEGILLRTTVMTQQSEIVELRAADQRRQTVISELLKADYRRQRQLVETLKIVKSLKAQMTELQRQQGGRSGLLRILQSSSATRGGRKWHQEEGPKNHTAPPPTPKSRPVTTTPPPVTTTPPPVTDPTTTTSVTSAQLQAMIDEGVTAVLAARAMTRNGYNSNGSGPRPAQTARECSYSEFLKCKPLDFKGTEGVVGLTRWFEKMECV
ncbi:hypothetical protein Tco_1517043 [Tanacetum coccineum]